MLFKSKEELINILSLMYPLASAYEILLKAENPDTNAIEQWLLDIDDELLRWTVRYINYFDLIGYEPLLEEYESRTGTRDVNQFVSFDILKQRKPPLKLNVFKTDQPEDCNENYLEEIFNNNGNLSQAFTSYEQRIEQIEMAKKVWHAFNENKHLLIEAGTGTGKSLGYLIPSILYSVKEGKPIVISSATINLQEQLLSKDIPIAQKAYPHFPFTSVVLKGRNHYACLNRWRVLIERLHELEAIISNELSRLDSFEPDFSIKIRKKKIYQFLLYLTYWLINTDTGDFDTVKQDYDLPISIRERIFHLIDSGFKSCIVDKCPFKKSCLFYNTRDLGSKCNIIITNHALLFALFDPENEDAKSFLETCQYYILDEAHNLEDCITNAYAADIHPTLIFDLLSYSEQWILNDFTLDLYKKIQNEDEQKSFLTYKEKHTELTKSIQTILFQCNDLIEEIKNQSTKYDSIHLSYPDPSQDSIRIKIEKKFKQLFDAIKSFLDLLKPAVYIVQKALNDYLDLQVIIYQISLNRLIKTSQEIAIALSRYFDTENQWIRWLDLEDKDLSSWRLWAAPINPQEVGKSFFNKYSSVVLTSATLTVANDFSFICQRLGLTPDINQRVITYQLQSPFDYKSQAMVLIPTNSLEPRWGATDYELQNYQIQLSNIIIELTTAFQGGILVLFNNYRDMKAVYELTVPLLNDTYKVLCQGLNYTRSELAEEFKRDGNAVLLATRSFWEGFDVPGPALRCLVLTKLPFNSPSEPIFRARANYLEENNVNSFATYSIPLAVIRLTQGFGRLIRTKNDYGCIFILDPRTHTKQYGRIFLQSLPATVITKGPIQYCIQAAKEWMQQRQSELNTLGELE